MALVPQCIDALAARFISQIPANREIFLGIVASRWAARVSGSEGSAWVEGVGDEGDCNPNASARGALADAFGLREVRNLTTTDRLVCSRYGFYPGGCGREIRA
jgi:hypothetical protein